ncbi:hypothetical protein VCHC57A1_2961, partial [Vibrio cholerae HC-57A1]
MKDSHT